MSPTPSPSQALAEEVSGAAARAPSSTSLELHQGLDYAVLMRPDETTDDAFIQIRYPTDEDMALLRVMATAPELLQALKDYVAFSPAFRSKPMGAPNSIARIGQSAHILIEDRARAAIAKAEGRP